MRVTESKSKRGIYKPKVGTPIFNLSEFDSN